MSKILNVKVNGILAEVDYDNEFHKELICTETESQYYYDQRKRGLAVKFNNEPYFLGEIIIKDSKPYKIKVPLGALLFLYRRLSKKYLFNFTNPEDILSLKGEQFEILDSFKQHKNWLSEKGEERKYFFEALDACKCNNVGIVKLGTGVGKTPIELALAYNQAKLLGKGLYIVPTNTILYDVNERAKSYGIEVASWKDYKKKLENNEPYDDLPKIILFNPKSLNRNKLSSLSEIFGNKFLSEISWIIYDECQHLKADSFNKYIFECPNLKRVHGFSAKPVSCKTNTTFKNLSASDAKVLSYLGDIIYEKSYEEAIDEEFINNLEIVNFHYKWTPQEVLDIDKLTNSWTALYDRVVSSSHRNSMLATIMTIVSSSNRYAIMHNSQKKHSENILKIYNRDNGICWFADGFFKVNTSNNEIIDIDLTKEELISKMQQGLINNLLVTSHAIEGLNLEGNQLNTVILSESKSPQVVIQKVGRGLRKSNRKTIVINIFDDNIPILRSQSIKRKNAMELEYNKKSIDVYNYNDLCEVLKK